MKILFCTNTFQNIHHGPAKFANFVLELNNSCYDHEVKILTPDIDIKYIGEYNGSVFKLHLDHSVFWRNMISIYRIIPFYREVVKLQTTHNFDLVVFNNAITGLYSSIKLNNVIGMVNDDTSISVSILKPAFSREWVRRMIFKCFEFSAIKLSKAIIVNSKHMTYVISRRYNIEKNRLYILYKGINIPESGPVVLKLLSEIKLIRVLFVKSDFIRGGLEDLIKCLEILPQYRFQLLVVGPTRKFHQKIMGWHNPDKRHLDIELLGTRSQEAVYDLMKSSNIFCVPSRAEALGVGNLEAMAHQLPVVSTSVGGIPETLDNGANGWLAKPNDPSHLAEQIDRCIRNDKERLDKSEQAKQFVSNEFSKDKMLENFIQILQNIKSTLS